MPQIIVHMASETDIYVNSTIVKELRESLVRILQLPEEIGHVILYETPTTFRAAHKSRNSNFALIEISMYKGRSIAQKDELMKSCINILRKHTDISEKDILCYINEIPKENYFGGLSHN